MVGTMKADQGWSTAGLAQTTVSGGQFVKAMSASGGVDALEFTLIAASGDELLTVGIATNNATSGQRVNVALHGIFDMYAAGAVTAGANVNPYCSLGGSIAITDAVDDATTTGSVFFAKALGYGTSGSRVKIVF